MNDKELNYILQGIYDGVTDFGEAKHELKDYYLGLLPQVATYGDSRMATDMPSEVIGFNQAIDLMEQAIKGKELK